MNAAQKAEVLKIVSKDCGAAAEYLDENGQTCAVGAIARAAGVTDKQLRRQNNNKIIRRPMLYRPIRERFGLTVEELMKIQNINDLYSDALVRRDAVKWIVSCLGIEEAQKP